MSWRHPKPPHEQVEESKTGKDWIAGLTTHWFVAAFVLLFSVAAAVVAIYAFGVSSADRQALGEVSGPSTSLVAGDLSPGAPGVSVVECELDIAAVPLVGEQLRVEGAFKGTFCEAFELRVSAEMSTDEKWADAIHSCRLTNWQNLLELWMELDKPSSTWVGIRTGGSSAYDKDYLAYPAPSFDEEPFKIRYADIVSQVDRILIRFDMFGYDRDSEPFLGACSGDSQDEGPGFSIWWYP